VVGHSQSYVNRRLREPGPPFVGAPRAGAPRAFALPAPRVKSQLELSYPAHRFGIVYNSSGKSQGLMPLESPLIWIPRVAWSDSRCRGVADRSVPYGCPGTHIGFAHCSDANSRRNRGKSLVAWAIVRIRTVLRAPPPCPLFGSEPSTKPREIPGCVGDRSDPNGCP
jgi:hypothetical protein